MVRKTTTVQPKPETIEEAATRLARKAKPAPPAPPPTPFEEMTHDEFFDTAEGNLLIGIKIRADGKMGYRWIGMDEHDMAHNVNAAAYDLAVRAITEARLSRARMTGALGALMAMPQATEQQG